MKRIALGLVMVGAFALMAAQANAAGLPECGHASALSLHGTEPELSNDSPLHYIVGIGAITFAAAGTNGPTGCTVSHLDMIYNDNSSPQVGVGTFSGAPKGCYAANSALGGGVACFDGADHQNVGGTLAPSPDGNGAALLNIDPSFGWVDGAPGAGDQPLSFTLQAATGGITVLGNSVSDLGPTPTSPPPGSPVLVITLQKQSTTAVLPVTGANPLACGPLGCTGTGAATDNGYGVAPYLGLSISLFEGYGSPASNPFQTPGVTGSFGSTISALQIFSNGQAGGSASFSSNDNVGNTTGLNNGDCDTNVFQTGNFADGTSNDAASIVNPSPNCADAAAAAAFQLSAVQFGSTDTSDYVIVTGLTDTPDLGGALIPAGIMSVALGLPSSPPGKLVSTATVAQSLTSTTAGVPVTKVVKLTNTSPAGCDVVVSMATQTDANCSLSLSAGTQVVEGDTVNSNPTITCLCNGTEDAGLTSSLSVASSNCPVALGAGPVSVTCNN